MLLAPGKYSMLDRTLLQMVKDLITGEPTWAGDFLDFFEVGDIEVTHTPREDFPFAF
jgi:hypothetical protein